MEQLTLYHYLLFAFFITLAWTGFVTWLWSLFAISNRHRSFEDHEEHWQ